MLFIAGTAMGKDAGHVPSGEFTIRAVAPLNVAQVESLRRLVAEGWPLARSIATEIEAEITRRGLHGLAPGAIPVIKYEGLVNTDPRRLATVEALRPMDDVALLVRHWQLTGSPKAAAALRGWIEVWADTYVPTGNDVNENKLYPLFVAYEALRSSFSDDAKKRVDGWIEGMGTLHARAASSARVLGNRFTKRLRMLDIFGRILGRPEWQAAAWEGARRFVGDDLYADGSSFDLKTRDSLTYHCSALEPLLEMARISGNKGLELYDWMAPAGGSIRASVNYVLPYARGEKQREEWRQTTAGLDKKRAAAGIEEYQPGRLFMPHQARGLLEQAAFFDPATQQVVDGISSDAGQAYGRWIQLENEALGRVAYSP